jgi:hypothetical protein
MVGVLVWPKGSNIDLAFVLGVREGKVYNLQGKPVGGSKGILVHGSMLVAEDKEHESSKGEQSSQTSSVRSQSSDGKRELSPSIFVRGPSWYESTLMDAQEHEEAPRSTLRENKPSTKFVALDRYFHIGFVSNMWKSSLIPLKTYKIHFIKVIIKVNAFL